ncbi:MAG TPA: HAD-IA family hydrolase [Sphingomicrobium sp.]|nr:HAD-IA family hydrolase [Sphingomicrobium sp.]
MSPIIFDLDGTLVDSAPLCAAIINEMLRERGSTRAVTEADSREYLTKGGSQLVTALLGGDGGETQNDLEAFRDRYAARQTPADCLFPGVRDGLGALSRSGVRMAICSNKPQHLCDKIVADLSLASFFEVVVGSVPGRPLKPAPDLANLALKKFGAEAADCLYVGDSEVDRQTAAAAGIPFIFVTYGYAERGTEIDALARCDRFDELASVVTQRRNTSSIRRRVA